MVSFLILFPIAAAFPVFLAGRWGEAPRNMLASAVTLLELIACFVFLRYPDYELRMAAVAGEGIFIRIDGFRRIYCTLIAFMWAMAMLLSHRYFKDHPRTGRYYLFNLITEGTLMGVFLAGNLYTALIFFEIMSLTSFVWVAQEETPQALRAAGTYLAVAVIGGLAALMGLFLLHFELGTTEIDRLYELAAAAGKKPLLYAAGGCVLFGFGAKAGMFPLHIWLPKAHPVAPAPASALLSGLLTKSGIFGVIAISCQLFRGDPGWGTAVLVLGVITMVLGAVLALFSVDLKRTLACSSVSQIGFILVGIGLTGLLGTDAEGLLSAAAARGSFLHMMNHSLFKLVLFLFAGAVYMNVHKLDLNEVRGFGRNKMILILSFVIGAWGIAGLPFGTGYISKTLLHEGILELIGEYAGAGRTGAALTMRGVEGLFLLSGGCTLAYMLKLFVCLFIEKHPTRQKEFDRMTKPAGLTGGAALFLSAMVLCVLGLTSTISLDRIADLGTDFLMAARPEEAVAYFSWESLSGALITLALGLAIYFGFVRTFLVKKTETGRVYVNRWPARLDLEELLYRPLLLVWLPTAFGAFARFFAENTLTRRLYDGAVALSSRLAAFFAGNSLLAPAAKGLLRGSEITAHALSDLPDAGVLGLRRGLFPDRDYRPQGKEEARTVGRLSYRFGEFLERLFYGKKAERPAEPGDLPDLLLDREETARESRRLIRGNLSFALLMLCLAVCGVLIYVFLLHR